MKNYSTTVNIRGTPITVDSRVLRTVEEKELYCKICENCCDNNTLNINGYGNSNYTLSQRGRVFKSIDYFRRNGLIAGPPTKTSPTIKGQELYKLITQKNGEKESKSEKKRRKFLGRR